MKSTNDAKENPDRDPPRIEPRTGSWSAGPPDSELTFSLRHLVFTQITGRVERWKAAAAIELEVPGRSWVDVMIDASSLDTGDAERDDHVRSPEFLDTRRFPDIHFHSREVRPAGDGRHFTVKGDLTLRHVTRPITVELERDGAVPEGQPVQALTLTGRAVIDRQEFGLRWNQDLDRQGVVVGNQVDVKMRLVAHRLTTKG